MRPSLRPRRSPRRRTRSLQDRDEIALVRHLANWPRIVEGAAETHEPHRIAFYLQDLAAAFHGLWTQGHERARAALHRERGA